MPSLMELLIQTMPFAALEDTLKSHYYISSPPKIALTAATGADVKDYLRFIPNGTSPGDLSPVVCDVPTGAGIVDDTEKKTGLIPPVTWYHEAQDIWSFDLSKGAGPEELSQIACRVSGDHYAQYLVLERARFGYEESPGSYQPYIKAVTGGTEIKLPLEDKFLRMTWLTQATDLQVGHPLWKLESHHDKAITRVFVYELIGDTTTPTPLQGVDATEQAAFDDVLTACNKIGPTMADGDDAPQKLFLDTTFFPAGSASPVGAAIGGNASMDTTRTRIVVVLSWTMCRWRLDFPPGVFQIDPDADGTEDPLGGAPLAAARFYPNAMIIANAGFDSFEVSIQLDRPAQTTVLDGEQSCCSSGEMLPTIKSVLVTETNEVDLLYSGPPLAIWSNLFSYYQTDANNAFGSTPLHMVRNDAGSAHAQAAPRVNPSSSSTAPFISRYADPGIVTRKGSAYGLIKPMSMQLTKLQGQGEFDSIHIAPPMIASQVVQISRIAADTTGVFPDRTPISVDPNLQQSFQEIGMAPFCAHDCFHFHWRWSDQFRPGKNGDIQHLGWGPKGPYTEPGRPMVPLNQSIDLWYRADSQVTYHAKIGVDEKLIEAGQWQVVCHHGAAYGLDAESWLMWAVRNGMDNAFLPFLLDAQGYPVTTSGSWAVLYWRLRYTAMITQPGTAATLSERTIFHNFQGARDL